MKSSVPWASLIDKDTPASYLPSERSKGRLAHCTAFCKELNSQGKRKKAIKRESKLYSKDKGLP